MRICFTTYEVLLIAQNLLLVRSQRSRFIVTHWGENSSVPTYFLVFVADRVLDRNQVQYYGQPCRNESNYRITEMHHITGSCLWAVTHPYTATATLSFSNWIPCRMNTHLWGNFSVIYGIKSSESTWTLIFLSYSVWTDIPTGTRCHGMEIGN